MKKIRKVRIPNSNNKTMNKNFLCEPDENKENNCSCWVCKEQKIDKVKNVRRQNYLLGNIITFSS